MIKFKKLQQRMVWNFDWKIIEFINMLSLITFQINYLISQ